MAAPGEGVIRRERFSTADPDLGHAFIREMYVDVDVTVQGSAEAFRLAADTLHMGGSLIYNLQHTMAVQMHARDGVTGWQPVFSSRRPGLEIGVHERQHRLAAGDTMAFRPGVPYEVSGDSLDADVIGLDVDLLSAQAAAGLDPGQPFWFEFDSAVSPSAAEHWRRTVDLVRKVGLANASSTDGALLADELGQLLVSAALLTFPNPTLRGTSPSTRTAGPDSLRRALAHIETHLDQPMALADIAEAARVSPRALHLTFARHLDTTPMGYVRRARMSRAHHDLESAQPGDGQTVTSIARRWGFHSLPRFGVAYRSTYGRPPSSTLRRPRS